VQIATLAEAREYLEGFINLEQKRAFPYAKLGTGRVRALLAEIGNPHEPLPCVHIAGSKGKGTVALASEALLRAAGRRVGTYTSPHLESWLERFRIDGKPVAEAELVRGLRVLQPAADRLRADPERKPSFFDVSTALAFQIFRDARVDVGVIEVGLGGRLDSTNVCHSRVSVVTAIQLEHVDKLGSTLEAIATEKAGILRPGVPALHGPLPPEAHAAVLARAVAHDVDIEEVRAEALKHDADGLRLRLDDGREIAARVWGRHQSHNLALAVRAAERFLDRSLHAAELASLEDLALPARFERLGNVLLDCAHTPDSALALREALDELHPEQPRVLVVSISRDKDAASILHALAPGARACIACESEPTRSMPADEIEALAWACGIETAETSASPAAALARARELAGPAGRIVVTGSLYLAGALRRGLCEASGVEFS
jgi:dihydrofolate synthase / folylpolyglutamate synthase